MGIPCAFCRLVQGVLFQNLYTMVLCSPREGTFLKLFKTFELYVRLSNWVKFVYYFEKINKNAPFNEWGHCVSRGIQVL